MVQKEDVNKNYIIQWLFQQAPAVVVLVGISIFLWRQNERFINESQACNQEIIKIYQSQNERMIKALESIDYYIQTTTHGKEEKKR